MIDLKNMGETRAIMFITHDLGVVAEICDYVTVMYCGKVMERTDVFSLFREPLHPYTIGLMKSLPKIGASRGNELYTIPGKVPDIFSLPKGCKFAERCPIAESLCFHEEPRLREIRKGHYVRCHKV
jgi:oligopeptide/dipeptide ABC transporter ATP-binding protein